MGSSQNGDYVRLEDEEDVGDGATNTAPPDVPTSSQTWWQREAKKILLWILVGVVVVVIANWLGPPFMSKVVIPSTDYVTQTFDPATLAFLIFASTALFPTMLMPSTPSIWIAGMSFGYVTGLALVMAGVTIGVTLPYFIGLPFRQRIQKWLVRYPKQASMLRLAGQGSWFHQFRAVVLIRISPFPYILFNYAVAATEVKYSPYLLGSLVGVVPEILLTLYGGKLIRKLADATEDHHKGLSKPHTAVNLAGFSVGMIVTVTSSLYAKRRLEELRRKEELTLV